MEVKIGVQNATREIVFDTDMSGDDLEKTVGQALSGETSVLTLTDTKGRRVLVASEKIAFVEIGSPTVGQVGFRS
jgi:hypothetical protein